MRHSLFFYADFETGASLKRCGAAGAEFSEANLPGRKNLFRNGQSG